MSALLHPVHPKTKGVKWGLVVQTVAMFSCLTIGVTLNRYIFLVSYIDGRESPSVDGSFPGPLGYWPPSTISADIIEVLTDIALPLNQWLANGFLVNSPLLGYAGV